jgi:16S rRNA (cytosine1402-N4)-methyltransferase
VTIRHLPVLSGEVIELLSPVADGTYVDATIGLGGHSEEILKSIGPEGRIIGIDRDEEALKRAGARLKDDRVKLIRGSFSEMKELVREEGVSEVDGVLFDLGVSMMQLKDAGRGFSFYSEERLDMRMDTSQELSAWQVVNRYPERELTRILREYGEEYRAPKIARAILGRRNTKTIDTCAELAAVVSAVYGGRGRIHPATKTFQALRIEVNREIEELARGLEAATSMLKKGGKLCVVSYHSLEDRAVKNFIRNRAKEGALRPLSKKPLVPGPLEAKENPSARSAKLRGAEKI